MVVRSLKTKILISFIMVIVVLSVSIALLGFYIIEKDIIERAEHKVRNDLKAARMVYNSEIDRIGQGLRLFSMQSDIEIFRQKLNLHYLQIVNESEFSEIEKVLIATGSAIFLMIICFAVGFPPASLGFIGTLPYVVFSSIGFLDWWITIITVVFGLTLYLFMKD